MSSPSSEINIDYTPYLSLNRQVKAPSAIASYSISKDYSIIVMGGYSKKGIVSYVLDFNSGNLLQTLYTADSLDHIFLCTAISNDKSIAAAGSYDNYTTIWNLDDGSINKRLFTGTYTTTLLISPLNDRLVASSAGRATFWDYTKGNLLEMISTNDRMNPDISMNTSGNLLAFGVTDDIKIINTTDGNIISTLNSPGRNSNLTFYNNSTKLISIISNVIRTFDLNTNSYTEYISDGTWYEAAIEANQKYLILYSNNVIGIFDILKNSFINLQTNMDLYGITSLPGKNQFIGIRGFYFNIFDFNYRWQVPLN